MTSIRSLDEWELRQRFNASGLYERAERGELFVGIDSRNPDPRYGQPPGTVSQTVTYWEINADLTIGRKIAVLHQFVLPDGTINNAARRPDPKYLVLGDEILKLHRGPAGT